MKFATIFSGGEGAGVGAALAGADHLWGIEYDDQIAACARANGFDVITTDARNALWSELDRPDWLHMSPPCTRASRANQQGKESELDMELAEACLLAVATLRPEAISVENVRDYGKFKAYERLRSGLAAMGYTLAESVLNAADYGTPQTRERLFIIGRLSAAPRVPLRTHARRKPEGEQMMLDVALPPWRGWLAAIADLIPDLPDSELAPWQLTRMPADIRESFLIDSQNGSRAPTIRMADEPGHTITAATGTKGIPRAVIFSSNGQNQEYGKGYRDESEPVFTIRADRRLRAVLIGGGNTNTSENRHRPGRDSDQPAFTVTESSNRDRILIAPPMAICKKLNPRALARLNGLADSYILPGTRIGYRIIGNMVMPDVMAAIIRANRL